MILSVKKIKEQELLNLRKKTWDPEIVSEDETTKGTDETCYEHFRCQFVIIITNSRRLTDEPSGHFFDLTKESWFWLKRRSADFSV